MLNWIILIIAGLFEVGFTTCLALSKNFTDWRWSAGFFICITLSYLLLNKAAQYIPLASAFGGWTGIGDVGSAVVGVVFFKEPSGFWRLFCIATLILSIIGLKTVSH